MNLLVQAIRRHAEDLRRLDLASDVLPYAQVAEIAQADPRAGRLLRAAAADTLIASHFSGAFAGVVRLDEWNEARETGAARRVEAGEHGEWVTMIPVAGREFGLTLPEDALPERRLSLFLGTEGTARRVSVVALSRTRPALELRIAGGECGHAYRGRCTGGSCRDCEQVWIDDGGELRGYHCECRDPAPGGLAASEAVTFASGQGA